MNDEEQYFYNKGFNDCLASLNTNLIKELTDKEILGCWVEEFTGNALPSIDFARAILRKAQEK